MESKFGIYCLDDFIRFGSTCRGETIRMAIDREPEWVGWAMEEGLVELDDEAFEYYQERIDREGT